MSDHSLLAGDGVHFAEMRFFRFTRRTGPAREVDPGPLTVLGPEATHALTSLWVRRREGSLQNAVDELLALVRRQLSSEDQRISSEWPTVLTIASEYPHEISVVFSNEALRDLSGVACRIEFDLMWMGDGVLPDIDHPPPESSVAHVISGSLAVALADDDTGIEAGRLLSAAMDAAASLRLDSGACMASIRVTGGLGRPIILIDAATVGSLAGAGAGLAVSVAPGMVSNDESGAAGPLTTPRAETTERDGG